MDTWLLVGILVSAVVINPYLIYHFTRAVTRGNISVSRAERLEIKLSACELVLAERTRELHDLKRLLDQHPYR